MKRKYIIAQDHEKMNANFKYITESYNYSTKDEKKKSFIKYIIHLFDLYFGKMQVLYPYNKNLCFLYINEIKLFYVNNSFKRKDLEIQKCYLQQKYDRKKSVFLPIIISIIASIIYAVFNTLFWGDLIRFWHMLLDYVVTFINNLRTVDILLREMLIPILSSIIALVCMASLLLILALLPLPLIWMFSTFLSAHLAGQNFSLIVAKQYEIDYIEKLSSSEKYFELIEKLDKFTDDFFGEINELAFSIAVREELKDIDSIEKRLAEKYISGNKMVNQVFNNSYFEICEKEIIIKSIIYRAFLKTKDEHKFHKLVMKKDKLSIKSAKVYDILW